MQQNRQCYAQNNKKVITGDDIANSNQNSNFKESEWRAFLFSDLSCSFSLPEKPEKVELQQPSINKPISSFSYQLKTTEYLWQVTVAAYEKMDEVQFSEDYLKQSKALKGKFIAANELDGRPYNYNSAPVLVRQLISEDKDNLYIEKRMFLFKNRVMTFVISTNDYEHNYWLISKLFSTIQILSGESDDKDIAKLIEATPGVVRGAAIYKVSPEYPVEAKEKRIEGMLC